MMGLAFAIMRAQVMRAFGWITASATHILIAALALLLAWGWYERGQADKWHDLSVNAMKALREAQIAKTEAEAKSATLAKDNTDEHQTRLAGDLDATRSFIAAHRVQQCTASSDRGKDQSPALSVEAPALPVVVAMPESDVTSCAANHAYAMSAFDFAQGLVRDGLGEK